MAENDLTNREHIDGVIVRWWRDMPEHHGGRPTKEIAVQRFPYVTHPRENVSWYQAVAFYRWLSQKLGEEIRLPHEYEWEVAARYGYNKAHPWGSDEIDARQRQDRANHGRVDTKLLLGMCLQKRYDTLEKMRRTSGGTLGGEWRRRMDILQCQYRFLHKGNDLCLFGRGQL